MPLRLREMVNIGEDVSERLDVIPAQLRVLVTRRPKFACRLCSAAVAQAHAPEHIVPAACRRMAVTPGWAERNPVAGDGRA